MPLLAWIKRRNQYMQSFSTLHILLRAPRNFSKAINNFLNICVGHTASWSSFLTIAVVLSLFKGTEIKQAVTKLFSCLLASQIVPFVLNAFFDIVNCSCLFSGCLFQSLHPLNSEFAPTCWPNVRCGEVITAPAPKVYNKYENLLWVE